MRKLTVGLGDRSYPIIIKEGLLAGVGTDLKARNIAKRFVVVSDNHVATLYGDQLGESLTRAGLSYDLVTFPRGEASKNLNTVAELASSLARLGVDRKDGLIALGGGVTGDITGFLASAYMRGVPFVQVPTTLLAQVDSSVGGKTGVDIPEGKNLVGAFYQPKCVYIDLDVLTTLPPSELLNGLAEVIKYGVIWDAAFFSYLDENRQAILDLDLTAIEKIVARSCEIKAEVVASDERESDLRRILNYGHTIGHAVEAASGYKLDHGLAVAIGMVAVNQLAVGKNIFTAADAAKVRDLLSAYGLPVAIPDGYDCREIRGYLKTDKKTVGGRTFFVLPTGIGKVIITDDVSDALIDKAVGLS
ncbi:MAG: 3-dehydroquinate synthase [Proteobacteria bacterium]|nr:3-dehydroquinate synthase [Pseudomonadota bacterium]MBU1737696.1 3-dehydroquinate synthase [Pseudomonadota bacterium]